MFGRIKTMNQHKHKRLQSSTKFGATIRISICSKGPCAHTMPIDQQMYKHFVGGLVYRQISFPCEHFKCAQRGSNFSTKGLLEEHFNKHQLEFHYE